MTVHPIYRVRSFQVVAPYTLRVQFDDQTEQAINFEPVLAGELYGPLRDLAVFNQVRIDPEVHTLVWPNGGILIRPRSTIGPTRLRPLRHATRRWERAPARSGSHLAGGPYEPAAARSWTALRRLRKIAGELATVDGGRENGDRRTKLGRPAAGRVPGRRDGRRQFRRRPPRARRPARRAVGRRGGRPRRGRDLRPAPPASCSGPSIPPVADHRPRPGRPAPGPGPTTSLSCGPRRTCSACARTSSSTGVARRLAARAVVEGPNFAFGHNREGNVGRCETVVPAGRSTLIVVPPLELDGRPVSSSRVRAALLRGACARRRRCSAGRIGCAARRHRPAARAGRSASRPRTWSRPRRSFPPTAFTPCGRHVRDATWPGAATSAPTRPSPSSPARSRST